MRYTTSRLLYFVLLLYAESLVLTFWTLSKLSPANRSQFGPKSVHMHRSRATTLTEFRARSTKRRRNGGGAKKYPSNAGFICQQYQTTFRQLRNGRFSSNLATTRESWVKCRFWTEIYEKFPFRGHLPPNPKL